MNDVARVLEPGLLHDPLRRPVGRQGKADHLLFATCVRAVQASASDEVAVRPVPEHPEPVPVAVPMVEVSAEKLARLLVREDAAVGCACGGEGGHHPAITVHPAKLDEMLGAQAFGDQTVSVEGFNRLHVLEDSDGIRSVTVFRELNQKLATGNPARVMRLSPFSVLLP